MFKVTVDDTAIENVAGWSIDGGILVLSFDDGSFMGINGFGEFIIEREGLTEPEDSKEYQCECQK